MFYFARVAECICTPPSCHSGLSEEHGDVTIAVRALTGKIGPKLSGRAYLKAGFGHPYGQNPIKGIDPSFPGRRAFRLAPMVAFTFRSGREGGYATTHA